MLDRLECSEDLIYAGGIEAQIASPRIPRAHPRGQDQQFIPAAVMLSLCSVPEVHCISDALARTATVATTALRALQAQPHRVRAVCSVAVHKQAASLRPSTAFGRQSRKRKEDQAEGSSVHGVCRGVGDPAKGGTRRTYTTGVSKVAAVAARKLQDLC